MEISLPGGARDGLAGRAPAHPAVMAGPGSSGAQGGPVPTSHAGDLEQLSRARRSGLAGIRQLSLSVLKREQSWAGTLQGSGSEERGSSPSRPLSCGQQQNLPLPGSGPGSARPGRRQLLPARLRGSRQRESGRGWPQRLALSGASQLQSRRREAASAGQSPAALTFSRPNSHARSRGVFFALLMRHGLDWCWSSISDCGEAKRNRAQHHPMPLPPPARHDGVRPLPRTPRETRRGCMGGTGHPLTYHLIVPVLRREVQRDLPVQRGHVDGGGGAQQHPHRLHASLPGRVVQGTHPCRERGSAGRRAGG